MGNMTAFCTVMVWVLAIAGFINLLLCLACGDWISAIASLLATPVVCWIYAAFYAMVGHGFNHSSMHGIITFAAVAVPFIISSLIYAALTMRLGQAKAYLGFNLLILATLMIH
ncbi:MAG: hypothetical protein IJS14_09400 [Lentisphaeria bacterium]|nr:hypothetical protein [Lentisphaeria bacterium]